MQEEIAAPEPTRARRARLGPRERRAKPIPLHEVEARERGRGSAPASASSTACSAAAWSRARSCCSAAIPASASPPCSSPRSTGSRSRADRPGALRLRRGVGAAGEAPRRAARASAPRTSTCSPRPTRRRCCTPPRRSRPPRVAIDSIQTQYLPELQSAPGHASRRSARSPARLMAFAKTQRDAGLPRRATSRRTAPSPGRACSSTWSTPSSTSRASGGHPYRVLRAHKNRFGSANEIGVFEMKARRARRGGEPVGAVPRRAAAWTRRAAR